MKDKILRISAFVASLVSLLTVMLTFQLNQASLKDVDSVGPFLRAMKFQGTNWTEFVLAILCYLGLILFVLSWVFGHKNKARLYGLNLAAIFLGTGGAGDAFGLVDYLYLDNLNLLGAAIPAILLGLYGIGMASYLCLKPQKQEEKKA